MGLIYTSITLKNPSATGLEPVRALVDTGAITMCVPPHVALQLQLQEVEQREATVADGRRQLVPYAGPLHVFFQNRSSFGGALIFGDEVVLGAIPMEDMDLVINPARKIVMVNPESPNFPMAIVKRSE